MDPGDDPYLFTSDTLPSDPRFMATVANGFVGTRVFGDVMHVGGVYSGGVGVCHRADVPSPLAVRVRLDRADSSGLRQRYTLDTRAGWFTHSQSCDDVTVSQTILAHRSHPNLLAMELRMERQVTPGEPITVQLQSSFTPQSSDIAFEPGPDYQGGRHIHGHTLTPEVPGGPQPCVHLIWTPPPASLSLLASQSSACWVFLTALADTAERAQSCYSEGLALIGSGDLLPSHRRAWAELWAGSAVQVKSPSPLQQAVIGCLYYLLSSLPPLKPTDFLFGGLSPAGLSNGRRGEDYWGHVFWDQDTWMYPPVLLFYPELARAILRYRIHTLRGAAHNAAQQGLKGVKFAWESAVTGQEVCPDEIYGLQEIHINGDVCFAFQQYLHLTQDLSLFSEGGGWEVVRGIAEYWSSRVTWNKCCVSVCVSGVMPPDEFHDSVNNSVYTNAVAKSSLQFAVDLAILLQTPPPPQWQEISDKIKVPFDPEEKYHPEFDGYQKGDSVKQADVVLLGFPLGYPMSAEVRRNDLALYEPLTDPEGPAMTWGMFAVGWLELKELARGQAQLRKCFNNIQEPFKIWSECVDGSGAVNFLTGMGGFLQVVLFGYTGFRINKNSLNFDPTLPDDISDLRITGVCYLGNKLDFTFSKEGVMVVLARVWGPQHCALELVLTQSGKSLPLNLGTPVSVPAEAARIQKQASCWPL
ncbi:protein-glucosylgalactosylhydroxylysine glucosidase [Huso huso]|uniref:Protein-glucosylgalactosylhydroxylysine glucosidase n=1 Tax=Huso huso TaxID=61971 RepID=A0ABR0YIT1_HUSHU